MIFHTYHTRLGMKHRCRIVELVKVEEFADQLQSQLVGGRVPYQGHLVVLGRLVAAILLFDHVKHVLADLSL